MCCCAGLVPRGLAQCAIGARRSVLAGSAIRRLPGWLSGASDRSPSGLRTVGTRLFRLRADGVANDGRGLPADVADDPERSGARALCRALGGRASGARCAADRRSCDSAGTTDVGKRARSQSVERHSTYRPAGRVCPILQRPRRRKRRPRAISRSKHRPSPRRNSRLRYPVMWNRIRSAYQLSNRNCRSLRRVLVLRCRVLSRSPDRSSWDRPSSRPARRRTSCFAP